MRLRWSCLVLNQSSLARWSIRDRPQVLFQTISFSIAFKYKHTITTKTIYKHIILKFLSLKPCFPCSSLGMITKRWPDKQLTLEFQVTYIISQHALSRRPLCFNMILARMNKCSGSNTKFPHQDFDYQSRLILLR